MRTATLNAEFLQSTHLGDLPSRSNIARSLEYVPGRTLRGALAGAYMRMHGPRSVTSPEFISLFEGDVRFGPLFPNGHQPHPLSRRRHKYDRGPSCPEDADLALLSRNTYVQTTQCESCSSPLEFGKGQITGKNPSTTRHHTSIGGDDIAVDGHLFGRTSLASTQFSGELIAPEEKLETLRSLTPIWVGGRRTTHGRASVEVVDEQSAPEIAMIDDILVLRLASEAVFVDLEGFPTRQPPCDQIARILDLDPASLRIENAWARWAEAGSWHAPSSLPRPVELAVCAGSTYRIKITGQVPSADALSTLQQHGLGLRRHEGFGHVCGVDAPPPPLDLVAVGRIVWIFQHIPQARAAFMTLADPDASRVLRAREYVEKQVLPRVQQDPVNFSTEVRKAVEYVLTLSVEELRQAAARWTA